MSRALSAAVLMLSLAGVTRAEEPNQFAQRAREVTEHIQKNFFDPQSGVYFKSMTLRRPDYVWLQGVMFSNLVAAARSDPATYGPRLDDYFKALDAYWDSKVKIPGYEAAPTRGNGNDKYYDDNAWLVITFLEAYETNRDPRYLTRAEETLKFVLSGWDEEIGGGIWWHQGHKDGTKNACANGPAAVGCLRLARFREADAPALVDRARKIVAWTVGALQDDDGLFDDRKVVATGEVKRGKLTYNSALMLRAMLGLYRATGEKEYIEQARRIGKAGEWFLDEKTGVYRDAVRYAHFMVEADLELYRSHERRVPAQAGEEERGRVLREMEGETARGPDLERRHWTRPLADGRDGDRRRASVLAEVGSTDGVEVAGFVSGAHPTINLWNPSRRVGTAHQIDLRSALGARRFNANLPFERVNHDLVAVEDRAEGPPGVDHGRDLSLAKQDRGVAQLAAEVDHHREEPGENDGPGGFECRGDQHRRLGQVGAFEEGLQVGGADGRARDDLRTQADPPEPAGRRALVTPFGGDLGLDHLARRGVRESQSPDPLPGPPAARNPASPGDGIGREVFPPEEEDVFGSVEMPSLDGPACLFENPPPGAFATSASGGRGTTRGPRRRESRTGRAPRARVRGGPSAGGAGVGPRSRAARSVSRSSSNRGWLGSLSRGPRWP